MNENHKLLNPVWTPEAIQWFHSTLTLIIWFYIVLTVVAFVILMLHDFIRRN